MPCINEIIKDESLNDGTFIRMYPEGVFYKAYERSAWLACMHLGELLVKKRHVKKAGQDIVSVGFPKNALKKWAGNRKVDISDNAATIFLSENDRIPIQEFEVWKDGVHADGNECTKPDAQDEICSRIRSFPLENKTPMECMMFLSQLKAFLNDKN